MPDSGSGTGTPISGGGPISGPFIRSTPYTWLPLAEWARIMGYSLWEFHGITSFDCQIARECGGIWFQFPEQSDVVSREELAIAIKQAEDIISEYVNYNLLPDWDVEVLRTPKFHVPEYTSNITSQFRPKSVRLSRRHIRAGGIRTKTIIDEELPIAFIDKDGDGFNETAQLTLDLSSYDDNEIRIYYPGQDGEDAWEIRPIKIRGNVIEFPVWLIVRPEFTDTNCVEALLPTDDIYLASVDIYRVYNDTSTQARLIYEPNTFECAEEDCDQSYSEGCLYVRDERRGYVVYNPTLAQEPDKVELHYYSGWVDNHRDRPLVELDPYWKTTIAYLAAGLLDRDPRGCCGSNDSYLLSTWRDDMALRTDAKGQRSKTFAVTQFLIENPFGVTTRGAWAAYTRAAARRVG